MQNSNVVLDGGYARQPGAIRAAIKGAVRFDSMTDDSAGAMSTRRRESVDGALKAIENVLLPRGDDLEGQIVFVSANFTLSHCSFSFRTLQVEACLLGRSVSASLIPRSNVYKALRA